MSSALEDATEDASDAAASSTALGEEASFNERDDDDDVESESAHHRRPTLEDLGDVLERVLTHLDATELAMLAMTSSGMRAFVSAAPLAVRVGPALARGRAYHPRAPYRDVVRDTDPRARLESTLRALPRLASRASGLDLTGATLASDAAVADAIAALSSSLRSVTLDACHRVSRATADAIRGSIRGRCGSRAKMIRAASFQRCFGLLESDARALLGDALGWKNEGEDDEDDEEEEGGGRGRRRADKSELRALCLTHLSVPPPPTAGVRGGAVLTTLSLTNCAFEMSASDFARALSTAAPRLEVLGIGGSVFDAPRARSRSGGDGELSGAFYTLVPIRPRWRGGRRFLRTFAGASLRPPPAFNTRPRRLSTPPDAFQLHPDFRLYGTALRRLRLRLELAAVDDDDDGGGDARGGARRRVHRAPAPARDGGDVREPGGSVHARVRVARTGRRGDDAASSRRRRRRRRAATMGAVGLVRPRLRVGVARTTTRRRRRRRARRR